MWEVAETGASRIVRKRRLRLRLRVMLSSSRSNPLKLLLGVLFLILIWTYAKEAIHPFNFIG